MIKKVLLTIGLLATLQANAIVGLVAPSLALVVAGSVLAGSSIYMPNGPDSSGNLWPKTIGLFIGLAALDGEGGLQYKTLGNDGAEKLGITMAFQDQFNSEIEEVNMLFDAIKSEKEANPDMDRVEISKMWHELAENISPESFEVLTAISKSISK